MTEQPTLMAAPTASHMAEEWYLEEEEEDGGALLHGHRGVDAVVRRDAAAKGGHVAAHVEPEE